MKKKEKDKKRKMGSLLLLLFLTIILLSTSTYAWFTSNKTVRIEDINVNVGAEGGIQISTDASNWKTVIANTDITTSAYSGHTNQFSGSLKPVSTIAAVNSNHKLDMYLGTVDSDEDDETEAGRFELTTELLSEAQANVTDAKFIAFDVFLKLDTAANVYLQIGSGTVANGTSNGLENAARIALVKQGTTAASNSAATMIALNSATSSDVIIYEPNSNAHTVNGVAQAKAYYTTYTGVNSMTIGSTSTAETSYDGVKAVIAESDDIPLPETNASDNSAFFSTVTTTKLKTSFVNGTTGENLLIYENLAAGVTKIRVYMWVEGQDVDCENMASGSDLTYKLTFTLLDEATSASTGE